MKKLYVLLILVMITAGLFLILKTVKPQVVGIMKPSFFEKPEEIGAVVYRRFYADLAGQNPVVFGIPPQPIWHQAIMVGFLKAAQTERRPYDVILMEPQMPPLDLAGLARSDGSAVEVIEVSMNQAVPVEFMDRVAALKQEGKRILVYTASVYSTHLLSANPIVRLEAATGQRFFSITSAPLALRPVQEFLVDPPCVGAERDQNGTAALGCAILHSSRNIYRKQHPQEKFVSMMNRQGADDYLLMTSYPGQDTEAKAGADKFRMNPPKALIAPGE